ncbi:UDP-glucose 4-epimerase [compost metagenome]
MNAGLGRDISVNELALQITGDATRIKHVEHIHPQSEIQKLLCNSSKANQLLKWQPEVTLEEGIARTTEWIQSDGLN